MRLLTRSDFDGLACAVLLEDRGVVDSYKFVHPKDLQDGNVKVTENDVLANVPYVPGCGLWFDHHSSEQERLKDNVEFEFNGASHPAPSCARVIYDYYEGSKNFQKFDQKGLMTAVDRSDTADFSQDDILNPKGWVLLSFIMDPRTNLGQFKDYRISNYNLMMDMIRYCRTLEIDEILAIPDVQERINRYFQHQDEYQLMLENNCQIESNVIVIDLCHIPNVITGNRFIEYALYPEQNVSFKSFYAKKMKKVVMSVGHSIINRTCKTDVGSLLLRYGGGGHERVGSCQIILEYADQVQRKIIDELVANG